MRRWDSGAVALGLPKILLMENAARAALGVLRLHHPRLEGMRALLFMGGGDNGGDAACLARCLHDAGAATLTLHTRPLNAYTGAAGRHARTARTCGAAFLRLPDDPRGVLARLDPAWKEPDIVIDGLLGTGFAGFLRPPLTTLVAHINELARRRRPPFILALDVPSGLDALTGRPCPEAVRAGATVTFAAAKPGLALPWAREFTGALHARDIGIPAQTRERFPASFRLLDASCAALLPPPLAGAHKNDFGHVLVAGGSPGFTGAAHLTARAALRAGAGLVCVTAPASLTPEIMGNLPEIVTLPLTAELSGQWPASLEGALAEAVGRAGVLALGPGMGQSAEAAALLEAILAAPRRPPAVLDADALNMLARRPDLWPLLQPDDICTPHPGEAARLLGGASADVQADRVAALNALADRAPCVWTLKGAGTLIKTKDSPTIVTPYDIPALAVAGSGDVLTGCVAALRRRVPHSLTAAILGVAAHARAGLLLSERRSPRGGLAGELADALPDALAGLDSLPEALC